MKHQIEHNDIALLSSGLIKAGIKISALPTTTCVSPVHCHYINNPDGTLRWIWRASSKSAPFLRFYHAGSRKAAFMNWAVRVCIKAGLGKLVANACTLYTDRESAIMLASKKDWALFTGTAGENRKLVGWYADDEGSFFVKVPLSAASERNLGNEVVGTCRAHTVEIVKPVSRVINESVIVQNDIYDGRHVRPGKVIKDLPVRAIVEWAGAGLHAAIINTSIWWAGIEARMERISRIEGLYSPVLVARLKEIQHGIWKHTKVMMAEAHGDLTPWNIRHDGRKLHMIDWEMYATARPALYDVFHYIYQDNILIKQAPYKAIREQVDEYLSSAGIKAFIEANNIDTRLAEKLYLLDVISYYMDLYGRQEQWHTQISWLLQTWCEALGHILEEEGHLQPRQALLQEMVHLLHNSKYAVLKLQQDDISLLPATSDVDMCIDEADADRLYRWLCDHRTVTGVRNRKLSFMRRMSLVLSDHGFLHLDCIWQLKRRSLVFMSTEELKGNARMNSFGVKVPVPIADMRYTWLFYLLNGASVPDKYVKKYMAHIGLSPADRDGVLQYNEAVHKKMLSELRVREENKGMARVCNVYNYLIDTVRGMVPRKGAFITFSGVDGAGKSTIISALGARIEKELRTPVVVLRHRPSVLPILSAWKYGRKGAEERSVSSLPRTGSNSSRMSSYLRFAYYFADYLLGQFYVHLRYVWQGYTVLYDRYYFDLINDAKRSNIEMPENISRWLYRFLLKPDQNYFLFAPTGTILQRKKELDEDTINELTRKYMQLFSELRVKDGGHGYHAICNIDVTATTEKIFANIQKHRVCAN